MYTQLSLWEESKQKKPKQGEELPMADAEVILYRDFFDKNESDKIFDELYSGINWRQDTTRLFGKDLTLPRLTAWYGDPGKSYTYSKIKMEPDSWTPTLIKIKSKIEPLTEVGFNSVLLNLYRDGKDSVAWHSDDEPELGQNPIIGSVSFGGTRCFSFKHKQIKERKVEIDLPHGSFLLMRGETQHHWRHQIAKTTKAVSPRINLTFRIIK